MDNTKPNRFVAWLQDEPKTSQVLFLQIICAALLYASLAQLSFILPFNYYPGYRSDIAVVVIKSATFLDYFLASLYVIGMASGEELLFRILPLAAFVLYFGKQSLRPFIYAMLISMIFGALHTYQNGNLYHALLVCGGFGIVASLIFLKTGGQNRKILKPALYCFLFHACTNIILSIDDIL
jgi:hypothetical protein